MIGDLLFKDVECSLNIFDIVKVWFESIKGQLLCFIDFEDEKNLVILVNNYDWFGEFLLIDFLCDVGKNFIINYMMSKESVKC